MAESIKISELAELVSGSILGTTKVPVVDGGATKYTKASSIKAYVNSDVATDAELAAQIAAVNSTIDGLTTADISENSSYKYYTDARVTDRLNALSVLSGSSTSLTVTDGSTTRNAVDKITFSGATVTNDVGAGDVTVTITSTPSLSVGNGEGIPISNVDKIDFTGATITDNGNGDVTVVISGGTSTNISALNTFTGSANASISSINSFTGSIRSEINGIEAFTASFSSSVQGRITTLEAGGLSLPNGTVSSSTQIDYNSIQNTPAGGLTPTFLQGDNITITSSSIFNTVTINSAGGGGTSLPTEVNYYVISQSVITGEPVNSNLLLSSVYIDSSKTIKFSQFSQSLDARIGAGGGGSDYISNVSFGNNRLTFTGVGSAFNGSVTLADGIVSSSGQINAFGYLRDYDVDSAYVKNRLPNSTISSSAQISSFGFLNNTSNIVSSSAQIVLLNAQSGGFDTSHISENVNYQYYTDAKVQNVLNGLTLISSSILPSGSVSSSSQIDYQLVYNKVVFYTGSSNLIIASGSQSGAGGYGSPWVRLTVDAPSSTTFESLSNVVYTSGLISGSAQISNLGFLNNSSLTPLNLWTGSGGGFSIVSQSINQRINNLIIDGAQIPNGTVSGSSQVNYNFVQNIPTFAAGDGIIISQSLENAVTITNSGAAANVFSSAGTQNRILFQSAPSTTSTDANLTWNGTTLNVIGNTNFEGTHSLEGSNTIIGNTLMTGNHTIVGNTVLTGSFEVSGSTILHNSLFEVTGSALFTGSHDVAGNSSFTGTLTVTGNTTLSGSINIASGSGFYRAGNKLFNYGAFYDTTTQSGSANVSQSIQFNSTDYSEGVSITNNRRIVLENIGVYNIQFSAQIKDTGAGDSIIHFWIMKNGVNVPNSAGRIYLDANKETLAAWNYVVPATSPNDYYELVWESSDSDAHILYQAATGNIPAIPSIILTVTQVA